MKRASYREAIEWLTHNDDTSWADYADGSSVAAGLVADLFGTDIDRVRRDVQRKLAQQARERS